MDDYLTQGHWALGDERQAREILIAQRDDELTRTHPRWSEKLWGKVTKVTLGYRNRGIAVGGARVILEASREPRWQGS
jgi:hypothetical protein